MHIKPYRHKTIIKIPRITTLLTKPAQSNSVVIPNANSIAIIMQPKTCVQIPNQLENMFVVILVCSNDTITLHDGMWVKLVIKKTCF